MQKPTTTGALSGAFRNRATLEDIAFPLPSRLPEVPDLEGLSLFHLLELLAFTRRSGRLKLTAADLEIQLVLSDDKLHSFRVEGTDLETEATRVLVERGEVRRHDAEDALVQASKSGGRPTHLLFQRQLVSPIQVVKAIRKAQRDLLRRQCLAPEGAFVFEEGLLASGTSDPVETDFRAVVVNLFREYLERQEQAAIIPFLRRWRGLLLSVRAKELESLPGIELAPLEVRATQEALNGSRTMQQLFLQGPLDRHGWARLLAILFAFELLETVEPEATEKRRETPRQTLERLLRDRAEADHFAVLGLHWTCHPADIRRIVLTARQQFGEGSRLRNHPETGELASELLTRMEAAAEAIKDKGLRRAYREAIVGRPRIEEAAQFLSRQAEETAPRRAA